jgi:hypothetical protein
MHTDIWAHHTSGANPSAVFHHDRTDHQSKSVITVVMVPGEQAGAPRDATIITDSYLTKIIDPDSSSNPNIVANLEAPRVFDVVPRFNNDSVPDSGSE